MIAFLIVLCSLFAILYYEVLLRLYYIFSKKAALWLNTQVIVRRIPNTIFSCLKEYAGFKFEGDYSEINELPEQYLMISNHQSILDIVVHLKYYNAPRLRFIAKKELGRYVPLVSLMLRNANHCLIDRKGSPAKSMKAIDKFAMHVKKNNLIPVIFPEGTRSKDGTLHTFYAAGFRRLLNTAPMPVAVCALDGGWEISSVGRVIKNLRGGTYKIKLLKVYDAPTNKAEQIKILNEAKELIQDQLDEWRK